MDLSINVPNGKYVVAVSGGVDSVTLLDLLIKSKRPEQQIIVAHFDHGIRSDSNNDAKLVKELSKNYGLIYESVEAKLGPDINEADARLKRYEFLNNIKQKYQADGLITAHHRDDLIETSMINILRGTGRRGLTSLKSRDGYLRPLLEYPKKDLIDYAKTNNLKWNEDSTNKDTTILRNRLRLKVIPKMTEKELSKWLDILHKAQVINDKIDIELQALLKRGLHKGKPVLSRKWFIMLPYDVSKEVLLNILYDLGAQDIDKKSIERLTVQIKTLPAGKIIQTVGINVILTKRSARFKWR